MSVAEMLVDKGIWTPLISLACFMLIYAFGEKITQATKGLVSTMLIVSVAYIALFISGIMPKASPADTGLLNATNLVGTMLMITHLGTIIKFKDLLNEWKTVLICLAGFVGILVLCLFVGSAIFDREYAMTAVAPISGGIIAAQITAEVCTEAGRADLASFAFLVMSFQGFIGMPLASFFLKRQCDKLIGEGLHQVGITSGENAETVKKKLFKPVPDIKNTWGLQICKLALVAVLASLFGKYILLGIFKVNVSAAVLVLFFGILFHEIGFLDDNILVKAGGFNIFMLGLFMSGPNSYSSLDFKTVVEFIAPLFGLLIIGAIGIMVMSFAACKVLKVDTSLALACGLAAMFGFPGTLILTTDAVKGTGLPEEERNNLMDRILPKMIVAGFTTVTIASVIFAGIIAPMIFR